jgi:hypothetical protein
VISNGDAFELKLTVLVRRRDDGEVARATADVHDEHDVARLHLLAPGIAFRGEPRIEGGLRLFEKREVLETRGIRRLRRELSRSGVERRGDGEDDVLFAEREIGIALGNDVVPSFDEVLEVTPRRLDGADALDILRCTRRKDRAATIDGRMTEPALRARDDARRSIDAARSRVLANDVLPLFVPRQCLGTIGLVRDVEEGRQELARLDRPLRDELRKGEDLRRNGDRRVFGDLRIGERGVRRSEIDPHDVLRFAAHSSTSACATTRASWPATGVGSFTSAARHPL